jgi:hypothetical protein
MKDSRMQNAKHILEGTLGSLVCQFQTIDSKKYLVKQNYF